jgi:pilus assembly protein CpaC
LKRAARETFSPFGIEIHSDDSEVALRPLVRTHVVLAEVSRSFSRDLGVKWPTEYQAQVLPQVNTDAKVMLALQALEARGQAQVLASPNLLCRSGSEARFHAGGEFPIRLASRFTQGVEWKKHGVLLNVRPQADFHGNISLAVETEISLLDAAHSVDKIPALKTNTVKSHFDLPGKRTIALSGLIRQDLSDSGEGLPFLSSLPVLGRLFGSANFQKHLSELVIFVTPEIYVPESDEPIKMPEGWVRDEF